MHAVPHPPGGYGERGVALRAVIFALRKPKRLVGTLRYFEDLKD